MASFAEILAKQPKIKTRQALMIIGLQNDFIAPNGYLPVDTTSGFLDHIHTLIPKFRELNGHIIWVKTQYKADRLANTSSTGEGDALVIAGLVDGEENSSQGGDDESAKDLSLPVPQAQSRSAKHKQRALDLFKRVSSRRKALPVEEAKATVEEDEELFLLKRAKKNAACIPETEGVQFTKEIKELIESPRDAIITTTNYSAFLGTNLLLTLRARLVTEIYVCGCLTNVSVLATVIDGARHGIKINVVQDALGFRKQNRHDLALKRMEDFFDAWLVTSADILAKKQLTIVEPAKEEVTLDGKELKKAKDELEAMVSKLSLTEDPNATSKTPNGHLAAAGSAQSSANDASKCNSRSDVAGEDVNSEEELVTTLARTRRTNGAEQRPTDASEPKLVQTKTRMRRKKMKRSTEGSLAEPSVPSDELNRAATRKEVDSLKAAALSAEAESNDTHKQNDTEQRPLDIANANPVTPKADPSSAKASPDRSNKTSSAPPPESSSISLAHAATLAVSSSQSGPAKVKAPSPIPSANNTIKKPTKLKSLATLPVLGPGDHIAEGDSRIFYNLIPPEYCHPSDPSKPLAETIFQQLYNEVRWQKMLHQQGEVPRLVCCQGEFGDDGSKPVYRHPVDQTLPLLHFSPKVQWIRRAAEKLVGHPLNHVLIQLYRSGSDYISEHSDKTLDIAKDSSIVNVSFGAQRTMRLRTKRNSKTKSADDDEDIPRETQRVAMPHNSMFVLGLNSNKKWLHGIMADKRIETERSEVETAYSGARISLTFRNIATFLDAKEIVIWGQGATSKSQRGAADIINNDEAEAERMIRAFSRENHSADFDWDEWYGDGFDVLHLHEPPEQLPILFTSHNVIETKQIQLALWENKVNHTLLESPGLDNDHGSIQHVHFRDNDTYFTEVSGLTSVLCYIDHYYPLGAEKPVTAAAYSLLQRLSQIADFLPDLTASSPPSKIAAETLDLKSALHILNEQLKYHGGPFIAGKCFSIADCIVWPVVDRCVENWADWDDSEWSELAEYYRLAWKKKACLKKIRGELPQTGMEGKEK